jgi:EmrB/QacA subfamily drug resistance transporter
MAESAPGSPPSEARRVARIVAAAFFMQNLDGAILHTSLPQMASDFGVLPVDLNIGITSYLLATAAFVPLSAWVADRFGARRVFALAVVVFTAASLACGLARGLWEFAALRAVQGMGAALMTPVGRMVVLRSAAKTELVQATALITWPALIAPVVGPVLGGLITTYVSWRWNFLLNIPIGLVGLVLVLAFIPDQRSERRAPLDTAGFALSAAALICLLYGLERIAEAAGEWRSAAALLLAGVAIGAIAVRHFRRRAHPLLDLSPLGLPTFAVASVDSGLLFRIAISSAPFLLPLMLQVGFGLNPWQAGLFLLSYFGGNLAMKTLTTRALRGYGFRNVLLWNGACIAVSLGACALLRPETPWAAAAAVLFAAGLTRSMQLTALNTLAFADVSSEQRSSASSLSSMLQQVSMGLGTAFAAFLLNASRAFGGDTLLDLTDFHAAFLSVAAIALLGCALSLRLAPEAGAEVSGHRALNT